MLQILVIEDESELRALLTEFLGRGGHSVIALGSGREALELLQSQVSRVDAAIIDWHLPGISGRDVIEAILDRFPNTPIIITTGDLNERLRVGGADEKAVEVLFKPYSLRALRSRVEVLAAEAKAAEIGES